MKAKDIKVGEEYALRVSKHSDVQHVRVIEPGTVQVVINGPVHKGWVVETLDGWRKGLRSRALNRELISTWADHEKGR
jgi:hypothetical protein